MVNPSEKGMRDKLLLEMGECIAKLIEDPYYDDWESELLAINDVYNHLLRLGFKKSGTAKAIEHNATYVEMLDQQGDVWNISGYGTKGGVSLTKEEIEEEYENDDYDEKEYDEDDGELTKEEQGDVRD